MTYALFTQQAVRPAVRSFTRRWNHPQVVPFCPSCSHYWRMLVPEKQPQLTICSRVTKTWQNDQYVNSPYFAGRWSPRSNLNSPSVTVGRTCGETTNTLTHLMSPYYTERRQNHNLMYAMEHTFGYRNKKFIWTCGEIVCTCSLTRNQRRKFQTFGNSSGTHKVMDIRHTLIRSHTDVRR